MKKMLLAITLLLPQLLLAAANNSTYASVVEIKVWPTYIDIYLDANSICSNTANATRYVLAKEEKEMYPILLTAMTARMVTNINYDCRADGIAEVYGVRVKPGS